MKVLVAFNNYRSGGGGEALVVRTTHALLGQHGVRVCTIEADSRTIVTVAQKVRAAIGGAFSWRSKRDMERLIHAERPDVVHAHNLYPLLSPSVLLASRERGVPVVMTIHHFGLTCPALHHLSRGQVCESCIGGREYWCVLKNCRGNPRESGAYAFRSVVARKLNLFRKNVTILVALTQFARKRLLAAGFDADRVVVLPNMIRSDSRSVVFGKGDYVGFAGRLSSEKGVSILLDAAFQLPEIPFRVAGGGPQSGLCAERAPKNVMLLGQLEGQTMGSFYRGARCLVVPSVCLEMAPLVVGEAMAEGVPVIASRIGGLPELVEDDVTGLLFEPGNASELVQKIRLLWDDASLCRRIGQMGYERVRRERNEDVYYERLMGIYGAAIEMERNRKAGGRQGAEGGTW